LCLQKLHIKLTFSGFSVKIGNTIVHSFRYQTARFQENVWEEWGNNEIKGVQQKMYTALLDFIKLKLKAFSFWKETLTIQQKLFRS